MKNHTIAGISAMLAVTTAVALGAGPAAAACSFTTVGTTLLLDDDCTTDTTILIPGGFTLDGQGHRITAEDPPGSHFTGGVVENAGDEAHVVDVLIDTDMLANVCDAGADRLRGILFDGASGSVRKSTILNINQGPSGCQEGNAIEVRNPPFDGSHPDTRVVVIEKNVVDAYQKSGIVVNGDVDAIITKNKVGASATQQNLSANAIQVGFGAIGLVEKNDVDGNQNLIPVVSDGSGGTAILVFAAPDAIVRKNKVGGNANVGIFLANDSPGATVEKNTLDDMGPDAVGAVVTTDTGIRVFSSAKAGSVVEKNKLRCWDIPILITGEDPDALGDNKVKKCKDDD